MAGGSPKKKTGGSPVKSILKNAEGDSKDKEAKMKAKQQKQEERAQAALDEINALAEDLAKANECVERFKNLIHESGGLQDEAKDLSIRLAKGVKEIKASMRGIEDAALTESIGERLEAFQDGRVLLREIRPETRSLFSRFFLGRVNVKVWSMRERERLRDEYNKFKLRTTIIFMGFPLFVLLSHYYLRHQWKDTHWINIFHQLWLLYYYTSLALRENILLVNGSNIRRWWIRHHYVAALTCVVFLTWPPTPIYLRYLPQFTFMAFFQGVVQLLQLWYQQNRDYANRALGRAGHMDVSFSETLTEFPRELFILIPFLFTANLWMCYLGYSLLMTFATELDLGIHWTEYREEAQVLVSGVLALIMGIGNIHSILATLNVKKGKRKAVGSIFKKEKEEARHTAAKATTTQDAKKVK